MDLHNYVLLLILLLKYLPWRTKLVIYVVEFLIVYIARSSEVG
jgi:hypothetical protein